MSLALRVVFCKAPVRRDAESLEERTAVEARDLPRELEDCDFRFINSNYNDGKRQGTIQLTV